MSTVEEPGTWRPDAALVFTVRARTLPIGELGPLDRAWLVAALTHEGWTVAAIAARLGCSLRLIQTIKADNLTRIALYALTTEARLIAESSLRRMESRLAAQTIHDRDQQIARLLTQRDAMLDGLSTLQKEARHVREE